jgi:hypothetical protein
MNNSAIEIYQLEDGKTEISVKLEQDSVWLNLMQMTDLFKRDKSVISRHINNIFKENELDKNSVVAKNATTASDGKVYQVDFYNLDVIISVGYRIKSQRGTQFRIWANKVLKDFIVKGYAINEQLLTHKSEQLRELQKSVKILGNFITNNEKSLTTVIYSDEKKMTLSKVRSLQSIKLLKEMTCIQVLRKKRLTYYTL